MNNVMDLIKQRRSVRTYDPRPIDGAVLEMLLSYADGIENPFNVQVEFKLLEASRHGLTCPVVSGADIYIGGKVKQIPFANVAFGYSFEELVLYAQSLGLGTVWLGGTMNRSAFERAMGLADGESMPCATPIGYPSDKMTVRETVMRKAIKADERIPFEELFFDGSFNTSLSRERAGLLCGPLDAVRLAPSAVNKQPWRVVVADRAVHFYLKRSKGVSHSEKLDMQMTDMGIALCHFSLAANECGINTRFSVSAPEACVDNGLEYVASYEIEK